MKEVKEVKEEVKDNPKEKDQNQNGVTESAPPVSAAQVAAMEAQNETVNDNVTQMVDDPNVLKSEIDDIRKSVVSMSVGQPARTSTIVKEWLEQPAPEAPTQEESSSEDGGGEEEDSGEEKSEVLVLWLMIIIHYLVYKKLRFYFPLLGKV